MCSCFKGFWDTHVIQTPGHQMHDLRNGMCNVHVMVYDTGGHNTYDDTHRNHQHTIRVHCDTWSLFAVPSGTSLAGLGGHAVAKCSEGKAPAQGSCPRADTYARALMNIVHARHGNGMLVDTGGSSHWHLDNTYNINRQIYRA